MTPPLDLPQDSTPLWGEVEAGEPDSLDADGVDVVIVGAGLVGLTTALALAERGVRPLVLEAVRPGFGTTGGSTAKVTLLQGALADQIARVHGHETLSTHLRANRLGQERMREILGGDGPEDRDAWTFATDDQGERKVVAEAAALQRAGVLAEIAVPTELPFEVRSAVRLRDQFQVDPASYLTRLTDLARQAGARVSWPYRVTGVESAGDELKVVLDVGEQIRAKHVVLATLMPFPLRTALFAAARASRSYTVAGVPSTDIPQGMYISAGSLTRSFRPAQDDQGQPLLLVGGYGHPTGKENPARRHLDELAQWAGETFSLTGFTHRWSAQDYLSADRLPHVGPSPFGPDGLLVATGFGKWGFTNGTAAAELLAGTITGATPDWAPIWRPRLAKSARGWGRLLAANAEVGVDLTAGWVVDPAHAKGDPGEGEGKVVRGRGKPTAISKVGGTRRACSAVCTHLGGIVRWNDAEATWDCPLHGSRFAADGAVVTGPATTPLPPK